MNESETKAFLSIALNEGWRKVRQSMDEMQVQMDALLAAHGISDGDAGES